MKITKISIKKFNIELTNAFKYYNVTLDYLPYALIILETDQKIFGHGEVSLAWDITGENQDGALEIVNKIKSLIEEKEINEVSDIENILKNINIHVYGNTALKCGIEMALFDSLGKAKKMPIYKLLGGIKKTSITPQKVLDYNEQDFNKIFKIIKKSLNEDVKNFKLKVVDEKIIETLKNIFEKFPEINVVLDVNQSWHNAKNAIYIIKQIEHHNILWIEQPIYHKDFTGFTQIKKETNIPIMADESCHDLLDLENLHKRNCIDYVNIKLAKSGGILEAIKMIDFCDKHNIKYMLGDMLHSEIGTAYNLHAATLGNFVTYDLTMPDRLKNKFADGLEFKNSKAYIPKNNGLGIKLI